MVSSPHRIKILYVIGSLDVGGSERHLVDVVQQINKERFDVTICCLTHEGPLAEDARKAGARIHMAGMRGLARGLDPRRALLLANRVRGLYRFIKQERFDIVHGYLYAGYVLGGLAARWAGVPVILSSRRSLGNFKEGRRFYLAVERMVNRFTRLVIANSEAVRQDVLRQEGLPPEKVVVIHNGFDFRRMDQQVDGAAVRAALGLPADALIVVMVANLIHYKGHRYLLDAFEEVAKTDQRIHLLLVGEGPERGSIETQIRELGLSGRVHLLGRRMDVPRLLAAADIKVLASLEEGFSNAVLEAMAAGLPVVATRVGGNPEAVLDGVTGFLVEPGDLTGLADRMRRLAGDSRLRQRMGQAGQQRVHEHFTVEAMVQRMEELYLSLVAGGSGAAQWPK